MWRHMMHALPVDPSATMRELDFRSLHTVYATWRGRVSAAQPRRVHVACELLANPDRAGYGDGLSAVVRGLMGDSMDVIRHCMGVSWYLSGHAELSEMASKHGVPDAWHGHVDGEDFGFASAHVFIRCGLLLPA